MKARILAIAGSDSSGGAGIQADIKTITALGGYAATAITAITVQSTQGVTAIHDVPLDIIHGQIEAVLKDIGADAIKTGMLAHPSVIDLLVACLDEMHAPPILVVDPVMSAKGGATLMEAAAYEPLVTQLLPRARVVTPNLPEAEILSGLTIESRDDMARAASRILALGAEAVLLKGGHLPGPIVHDLLLTERSTTWFEDERIETRHSHGTGCTLASAVATSLAQGMSLIPAVERARAYVQAALKQAPGLGTGHGPIEHGHTIRPFP